MSRRVSPSELRRQSNRTSRRSWSGPEPIRRSWWPVPLRPATWRAVGMPRSFSASPSRRRSSPMPWPESAPRRLRYSQGPNCAHQEPVHSPSRRHRYDPMPPPPRSRWMSRGVPSAPHESRGRVAHGAAFVTTAGALDAGSLAYLSDRIARYESDGRAAPAPADIAWTLSVGTGIAFAVGSIVMAERKAARASASFLGRHIAGPSAAWLPLTHAVIGGSLGIGVRTGFSRVLAKIAASNSRTEIRYAEPPSVPTVSGGPQSAVAFGDLGLQGRRFVIEASKGCPDRRGAGRDRRDGCHTGLRGRAVCRNRR